jgi:hypothetical protein
MVGEPEQDLLVAVGQDPVVPVGHREKSLDAILDLDRHGHVRVQVFHARDREELRPEPGVLEIMIGAKRPAGREHQAARTLAGRDQERPIVRVAGARPLTEGEDIGGDVPKGDERHVGPADLARPLSDPLQHGRELERRVDRADDVGQELGLALTPPGFLVELRVLDGDGGLVGQEPGEILFLGGEVAAGAERDDQRADRAFAVDQR